MNYSQFFNMRPEVTLMVLLVIIFLIDFFTVKKQRKWFNTVTSLLMLTHILLNVVPTLETSLFGDMYHSDMITGVIKTILSFGTLIVILQSRTWITSKHQQEYEGEYYMLIISTLLGMNFMMSSHHFLLFFLGLELASVPVACLVALNKYRKDSAEAAAKFIMTAIFSSGIMLYGISFLYGVVGTCYFNDFALAITQIDPSQTPILIMGLVFFFTGLAFKISLVPFHLWTADTYQGAPTSVTAYLSVISKGAASFTLMIILIKVFASMQAYWTPMLYILIVLSITIANLFAIRQSEIKRFMAFSSISQAGYIMLAVLSDSIMGVTALVYYILVYIVANLLVFAIISAVEDRNAGKTEIDAYSGLYQSNPKLAFLMTLALFSLGGIPPFAGMFSKFFVFMAAVQDGNAMSYAVVFIALLNTVISLYYYLLIVKAMYINKTEKPLPYFKSDLHTKLAIAISLIGVLLFGVCSCVYDWISQAVALS